MAVDGEPERAARARSALDPDRAVVGLDDALDARQPDALARKVTAFVAIENLFDATYDVGRTPALTTGLPRAARVGLQIALP